MFLNKILYLSIFFMIFAFINSCVSLDGTSNKRSNKAKVSKVRTKIESNSVNGIAIDSENFDQYRKQNDDTDQNVVVDNLKSNEGLEENRVENTLENTLENTSELTGAELSSETADEGEKQALSDATRLDRLSSFLLNQLSSTKIEKITDEDKTLLESLSKDKYNVSGSIEEAAMAIFIINTVLTSVDMDTADSLYDMCIKYDFSMISALSKNPFLKTYKVYDLVLTANQKMESKNQGTFTARLENVVNKQVDLWSTLKQYSSSLVNNESNNGSVSNLGTQISSESLESGLDIDLSNATKDEERIFKEAQNLADSYRYKEAVNTLEKIGESSDFYKVAQQKMSEYSYLAVQDLRRKAAIAFQNSIPVSDSSIKKMYLQEAKKYLEVALTDFPHISQEQLSTVKENLEVIDEDLDRNSTAEE